MLARALIQGASELCPSHTQHSEQAFDDLPGRVPLCPLNATDVGAINAREVRQTILG